MTNRLSKQYQKYQQAEGTTDDPCGDCYRTAIACLLEMERDEVPHFVHLYPEELAWWWASVKFIEMIRPGWTLRVGDPEFPFYHPKNRIAPKKVIGVGRSPRGEFGHAVILSALTGVLIHDPYPGNAGLRTLDQIFFLRPAE